MGNIKSSKQGKSEGKEFSLTKYEYNFIMALAANRNDAYNKYQAAISTFLSYLAGAKWGYTNGEELDFHLDDEKKAVTVTPHPKTEE